MQTLLSKKYALIGALMVVNVCCADRANAQTPVSTQPDSQSSLTQSSLAQSSLAQSSQTQSSQTQSSQTQSSSAQSSSAQSSSAQSSSAQSYRTINDISYRDATTLGSEYAKTRCKLDLYYPEGQKGFSTVVWFHGGGLKAGEKQVPNALKSKGVAVVAVNYRLHPKVKSPVYIDDAAAAVAWTLNNIAKYGGSDRKVFVSGHSAGGYLTSMVGLDKSWLGKYQLSPDQLAGLIPYSGHTITHFTIRAERGIDGKQPIIDKMAPLFHVRDDCPPLLLITGDRELEMLGRYEENAYLWRMMRVVGHKDVKLLELDGYNHGQMAEPAHPLLIKFMKRRCQQIDRAE